MMGIRVLCLLSFGLSQRQTLCGIIYDNKHAVCENPYSTWVVGRLALRTLISPDNPGRQITRDLTIFEQLWEVISSFP